MHDSKTTENLWANFPPFSSKSKVCKLFHLIESKMCKGLNFLVNGQKCLTSFLNDKIFDLSKFKAFADDKKIMSQKLKCVPGRVKNTVGRGENAGSQHFLRFSHNVFKSCLFQRCSKSGLFGKHLKPLLYDSKAQTLWFLFSH